jgi:hypothetical protein
MLGLYLILRMLTHIENPYHKTFFDTGKQIHPHVDFDQPFPPVQVVDSLISHDFLYTKFPSKKAISEVMASIDKPREDEDHYTFLLLGLVLMRDNTMSLYSKQGALDGTSSRPPSIDPFPPWLYFSQLASEFSYIPSTKYLCFVLPLCIYGSHQGYSIAQKTTHDEYLRKHKFILMWHGLCMVSHMIPIISYEFIDYEKYPWP